MNSVNEVLFSDGETQVTLTSDAANGLVVKFTGTIEHPNPGEFLEPLLLQVHEAAVGQKVAQVSADFSELDFLNSSGIKSFVKWIMNHLQQPVAERYQLRFVYSPAITWQQGTLKALTVLSRGAITMSAV
jgi:hypothetical protein